MASSEEKRAIRECCGLVTFSARHSSHSNTAALFTESIAWFIEAQAFLRSYDSASRPPRCPPSREQVVSLSQSSCVPPVEFTEGPSRVRGRERGGWGAKSYDGEKAWPSINHSLLSALSNMVPSNAHISTPFFKKIVFFSKIFFDKPPQNFWRYV